MYYFLHFVLVLICIPPSRTQVIAFYQVNSEPLVSFSAYTSLQFSPSPIITVTNPPDLSPIITPATILTIDLTDSYTSDGITFNEEEEGRWEWEWEWDCFVPREGEGRGGGGQCLYEGGEVVEMPGRGEGRFEGGGGERGVFEVGVALYFVVKVRVREREEGGRLGEVVTEGRFEKVFSVIEGEEQDNLGLVIEENQWICGNGAIGYSVSYSLLHYLYDFFF